MIEKYDYFSGCHAACMALGFVVRKRFESLKAGKPRLVGLTEFDVDKTMRFAWKTWGKRPGRDERARKGLLADLPIKDLDDWHGHRMAFPARGGLRPALDIMRCFNGYGLPASRMFELKPEVTSWGQVELLVPQVSFSLLLPLRDERLFDNGDLEFLEKLGAACGVLDERQMIAIGRHETAEGTQQSVIWEFRRWYEKAEEALSALDRFLTCADDGALRGAARSAWVCWSLALECKKKTGIGEFPRQRAKRRIATGESDPYGDDWAAYEAGLPVLREAMMEQGLDASLLAGQSEADAIWQDARVARARFPAFCIWTFASYFVGTLANLSMFRATAELGLRLPSLTPGRTKEAFRAVQRFLAIPGGARPGDLSTEWWKTARQRQKVVGVVAPDQLWRGMADLSDLLASAQGVVDWLASNYIIADAGALREQKA